MIIISVIVKVAVLLLVHSVQCQRHALIINGDYVKPGEIPFQISLQYDGTQHCGGSILNQNFVLTATHCVLNGLAKDFEVIAGAVDLDHLENYTSKHQISKIIQHEEYKPDDFDWRNDIALLKVNPPFKFSKYIAPAKLPSKNEVFKDRTPVVVSGYGKTSRTNEEMSSKLMKTTTFLVNQTYCEQVHVKPAARPTNICANNFSAMKGDCTGDSGGPLYLGDKVIGIVAWSLNGGCAPVQEPQVYTRVSSYIDWIYAHMKQGETIPSKNCKMVPVKIRWGCM